MAQDGSLDAIVLEDFGEELLLQARVSHSPTLRVLWLATESTYRIAEPFGQGTLPAGERVPSLTPSGTDVRDHQGHGLLSPLAITLQGATADGRSAC